MKSIKLLTVSFLLSVHSFYSQDIIEKGPFPVPKYFDTHDTYVSDEAIVLNLCPYIPVVNLSNVKYGIYHHILLDSQSSFTTKYIKKKQAEGKGIVLNAWYSGDTITEFVVFHNPGFPNYECTFAILTRSCKTLENFGEQKILAKHKFYNGFPDKYRNIRLLKTKQGFAFVELVDEQVTITFLSADYEEINKIRVDGQALSSIVCKECYYPQINPDGSILLVFPDLELGPINNSKDQVLLVSENGDLKWFKTIITNSKDILASYSNYKYNPDTKELSRVFFACDSTNDRKGYGIITWNSDGDIMFCNTVFLNFEDVFKIEPKIQDYFSSNNISTTNILGRLNYFPRIYMLKSGKENYIIIQRPHMVQELISATYIIKIDDSGNPKWIKPFLSEIRHPLKFVSGIAYTKDGKLNFFLADYSTNSENNEHVNKSFKKVGESISFFNIVLDPLDGSEISNYKYNVETEKEVEITNMSIQLDNSKFTAVVELKKGKQLYYKIIKL